MNLNFGYENMDLLGITLIILGQGQTTILKVTILNCSHYLRQQIIPQPLELVPNSKILYLKKYGSNGLLMPDYFSIEGPPLKSDVLDESIFIQSAHAKNHWVVISNYNPSEPAFSNNWYIYDSLNNPDYFFYLISPLHIFALKDINKYRLRRVNK
ncbi:hypothetical protein BpHYR1_043031 [Brachionus plicatilis]|uniref:Uncharacterized protein n=1 Tax=Brachionus plicatilis TaxID=10195 RepID=A0A3M7QMS8_BRAPC|nr:hypothetical protein BpHYR1_043031 [Brachionus plicatilis]